MTTPDKPETASAAGLDVTVKDEPRETGTRPLSPPAKRALAEAEARRKAKDAEKLKAERELGGRGGADPARYGDWEINGRANMAQQFDC